MLHGFHGGVRPVDRKGVTRRSVCVPLEHGPAQVTLPFSWCGGEPVRLLVRQGDAVLVGQRLAEPEGEGIPLYASVSGRVAQIGERAVVLQSDGLEAALAPEGPLPRKDRPAALSGAEILECLRRGAVWDARAGAAWSVLREAAGRVKSLVIDALECESYITSVQRLLLERPGEVLGGIRLMMRVLHLERAVLAVSGDMAEAIATLQSRLPLRGGDICLKILRRRYPSGNERVLAQQLTGRQLRPGMHALDAGVLILSAACAAGAYSAVYDGCPETQQIVTVAGGAVERPGNYLLPLGVSMGDVLREVGLAARAYKVVVGGAMSGAAVSDLTAALPRCAGALLALTERESARFKGEEGVCLHCGQCVEVCPMKLEPLYLRAHADARHMEALEKLHIDDCIECGACSYVCPGRIQLTQSIRRGKARVRTWREEETEA